MSYQSLENDSNIKSGYRGYVFSRPIGTHRVPQNIQNLVIRNYASRHKLQYLLSGVEYRMEECFVMLGQILKELPSIQGVIIYSMFMLPKKTDERLDIFENFLDSNCSLHAAVEGLKLENRSDISKWESSFLVERILNVQNFERDIKCRI